MLYAYTRERRPYSATLYPTSFTFDSLLALTISVQRKTYGGCSTPGPMAGEDFSGHYDVITDWVLKGEGCGLTTPLL